MVVVAQCTALLKTTSTRVDRLGSLCFPYARCYSPSTGAIDASTLYIEGGVSKAAALRDCSTMFQRRQATGWQEELSLRDGAC